MKTLLSLGTSLLVMVLLVQGASAELLLSDDFEDGDQSGWTSQFTTDATSKLIGTYSISANTDFYRTYRDITYDETTVLIFRFADTNANSVNAFIGFSDQTTGLVSTASGSKDIYFFIGGINNDIYAASAGGINNNFANRTSNTDKTYLKLTIFKSNNSAIWAAYDQNLNHLGSYAATIESSVNNTRVYAVASVGASNPFFIDNFEVYTNDTASSFLGITQSTYNLTSAYLNKTAWRDNTAFPVPTIDTTPTVKFDTNIASYCRIHTSDANWTTMGDARNCSTTGTTSHVCSLGAGDAFTPSLTAQPLYIGCIDSTLTLENTTSTSGPLNITIAGPSEIEGRNAILAGLDASEIAGSYASYEDRQVASRIANGSQYQGTFDLFVASGSKRWAFSYDPVTDSGFPAFENITPIFWFWDGYLLAPDDITAQVSSLINSTN